MFDESVELSDNAMLKIRPELFYEWNFVKNDMLGLDVYEVTRGQEAIAWWNCPKCETAYDMRINDRSGREKRKGLNCPFCNGRRVNHTNSLRTTHPHLLIEWHTSKNIRLTPDNVTSGSGKKAWWECKVCQSDYEAKISGRTGQSKTGCPYCCQKKLNETNSLQKLEPSVASEWHPVLNRELKPTDVVSGSSKKVWWKCSTCESSYDMTVANRTGARRLNCPYCRGYRANHTNSLASLNPELATEWHPKKNTGLTPHDVTEGSSKKVWWLGKCGHEWESSISNRRPSKGNGCPYCANQKVLVGFNDMWTTKPEISKMLANPEDGYVHVGESNRKVDWNCSSCGNLIKQKPISGIKNEFIYCHSCSDGVSYAEKFVFNILKAFEIEVIPEKVFEWSQNKRYDFYLPDFNWIIEVHGKQHYQESFNMRFSFRDFLEEQDNDTLKELLAIENGINNYVVIDAREPNKDFIKLSISESIFNRIIDLKLVNWEEIHKKSTLSLIQTACDIWNSGLTDTTIIAKELGVAESTAQKYLREGNKFGLCKYPKMSRLDSAIESRRRSVVQMSKEGEYIREWRMISDVERELKVHQSSVGACCRGKVKTAGGYKWMYKEEYEKMIQDGDDNNI